MARATLPSTETELSSYADSVDSSPRSRGNGWDPYRWDDTVPAPPATGSDRLRLMCSHGGRIVPRPHDRSLCYVGGETLIVVVNRHLSLSDLSAQLSRRFFSGGRFTLKYQLPAEDLDSLISVSTAEDLENMIEEYDRCLTSARPSRLRLFLFPVKPETAARALGESWFVDALNGATNAGGFSVSPATSVDCLLGLESDDSHHGGASVASGAGRAGRSELQQVPDSPKMETASSYGSTSSALSVSNLPPIRVWPEELTKAGVSAGLASVEEQCGKLALVPESVKTPTELEAPARDNPTSAAKSVCYQEPVRFPAASVANPSMVESKSELPDQNYRVQMQYPADPAFIVSQALPKEYQYVHHQAATIAPPPLPSFYQHHPQYQQQQAPPQHVDPTMPIYLLPHQISAFAAMRQNQAFNLASYQSAVADPSSKLVVSPVPLPVKDQFSVFSYGQQPLQSSSRLPPRPDLTGRAIPVSSASVIHGSEQQQFTGYRYPLNSPHLAYDYGGPPRHMQQYYTQTLPPSTAPGHFPAAFAVDASEHLSPDSKQARVSFLLDSMRLWFYSREARMHDYYLFSVARKLLM